MDSDGFTWLWVNRWKTKAGRPNLVFLSATGQYSCTVTGGFNTKAHGMNVARLLRQRSDASSQWKACEGAPV